MVAIASVHQVLYALCYLRWTCSGVAIAVMLLLCYWCHVTGVLRVSRYRCRVTAVLLVSCYCCVAGVMLQVCYGCHATGIVLLVSCYRCHVTGGGCPSRLMLHISARLHDKTHLHTEKTVHDSEMELIPWGRRSNWTVGGMKRFCPHQPVLSPHFFITVLEVSEASGLSHDLKVWWE